MDDYRLIRIEELEVFAHHGVFDFETEKGQNFYINSELMLTNTRESILSDDLNASVNYAEVCEFFTEYMKNNTCKLLERIAEQLCTELLNRYDLVESVILEIRKPEAPIGLPFGSVSVERKMSRHTAYLSLGSNMGDKKAFLDMAIDELSKENHTKLVKASNMLVTKAYGYTDQDDFLNMAAKIETYLSPSELLDFVHTIEQKADRKREIHWGPRTLDIDIVFYDRLVMDSDDLIIPHVDMQNREFVLKPMSEIAPNMRHPLISKTVTQMLDELKEHA